MDLRYADNNVSFLQLHQTLYIVGNIVDKNNSRFFDRLARAEPAEERCLRCKNVLQVVGVIARIFRGASATRTEISSWSSYRRDNTKLRSGMKSDSAEKPVKLIRHRR
jgi:hypothetical protein